MVSPASKSINHSVKPGSNGNKNRKKSMVDLGSAVLNVSELAGWKTDPEMKMSQLLP